MAKQTKDETIDIFAGKMLYREWGYYLIKHEKYVQAMESLKKAMKASSTDDYRTIVGLCKAHMYSANHLTAASMAEKCLQLEPRSHLAKLMRAETLFLLCEFDCSLVYAYQGMRRHKFLFKWGVYQGNETIEDCVGKNTSPKALQHLLPYIKKLQKHRQILVDKLNEEEDEFEGIDEDQSKFKDNDPNFQREMIANAINRIFARVYLYAMFYDKYFATRIMECMHMTESPSKKTTEEIYKLASDNYQMALYHQNIFRERRPFYCTLFQRMAIPPGHRAMIHNETLLRSYNVIIEADFLLHKLHTARMCKDYLQFFRNVDRIRDKFVSYPDKIFPLKSKCLDVLYKMIAWVYIDARTLACLYCEKDKMIHLKHHLGIHVAKLPRDHETGWVCKTDRRAAFRDFRRRVAMASESTELAWLFHEFCKFLIEIRRFDLARFYAKKARDTAIEAKSDQWILNANHLMIRIEYDQNNRNEARDAALMALAGAKKLGIDYLMEFYTKSLEVIDEVDVEKMDSVDGITARQQLIYNLMPENMKTMVDFLWKNMEAVPAKRRMSVMPGCKTVDRRFHFNCKRTTIMKSPPKNPEKEARQALLKSFELKPKRPGFINLV